MSWVGPKVKTVFDDNDEKAVEALVNIIYDYTEMVEQEEFHGFAVASLVTHLRAYLYPYILAEQRDFYSSITLSGAKKGTGKEPIVKTQPKLQLNLTQFEVRHSTHVVLMSSRCRWWSWSWLWENYQGQVAICKEGLQ